MPPDRPASHAGAGTGAGARTVRILGIDPGSRLTGYGVVDASPGRARYVDHGVLRLPEGAHPERLLALFRGLSELVKSVHPDEVAVEQVFVRRNVSSALVLGQVRGVALCAVAQAGLPVHEYAPARIKQAVAGTGRAEKPQVQHMVKVLLNMPGKPPADAADALACALCHAHSRALNRATAGILERIRR